MKYNIYKLLEGKELSIITKDYLDQNIANKLEIIEEEIIKEYLLKQDGKTGITTLGNEIRFNSILKEIFSAKNEKEIIIKMTENKRSFLKIFIDTWIDFSEYPVYFFILDTTFGTESNLVDNSFIKLKEIKAKLNSFFQHFHPKSLDNEIYFIEFKGFTNYFISEENGFTKIINK